jgi:predicted Zn finger-like uncharacterized protein
MILQCPECHARFAVPDTAIPPAGRTVKCGRCAHSWHASQADAVTAAAVQSATFEEVMAAAEPSMRQKNTAPKKSKPTRKMPSLRLSSIPKFPLMMATPVLALLWLTLAFVGHYPTWMGAPVLGSIYKTFGIQSTEGLRFDEVTMQRVEKDGKTNYILAGSIANQSSVERIVPSVRVALNDTKGKKLWTREYVVNETIKGGDVYPFRIANVETTFGDKVSSIVVDVGHPLQLMMR